MIQGSTESAGNTDEPRSNGAAQHPAPARRGRSPKNSGDTLPLDFTRHEGMLSDLKAFAQLMGINLNEYMLEAVQTRFKADRDKLKTEFTKGRR